MSTFNIKCQGNRSLSQVDPTIKLTSVEKHNEKTDKMKS